MKKIIYLVFLTFFVLGCSETKYNVNEGTYDPARIRDQNLPGTQIRWNNVSVIDAAIRNKVFVESTNSRRTPTGTLEVWAVFRNRTEHPLQLEARSSFYDSSQAPVDGPTAWQRMYLPPNGSLHYKDASIMTDIGYYHIEVKEGR